MLINTNLKSGREMRALFDPLKMTELDIADLNAQLKACEPYLVSTKPTNKALAKSAIFRIYRRLGLNMPKIIWTQSSFETSICIALVHKCSGMYLEQTCLGDEILKCLGVKPTWSDLRVVRSRVQESAVFKILDSIRIKRILDSFKVYRSPFTWEGTRGYESSYEIIPGLCRDENHQMFPVMKAAKITFWEYIEKTAATTRMNSGNFNDATMYWQNSQLNMFGMDETKLGNRPHLGTFYSAKGKSYKKSDEVAHALWAKDITKHYNKEGYWDAHWGGLRDTAYKNVLREVGPKSTDDKYLNLFGQTWAPALAYYKFLRGKGQVGDSEHLNDLEELCQSTGQVVPFKDVCFVSEPHSVLKFDETYRLHCEDGPALAYANGYESYAWHGTDYPKSWSHKRLTAEEALRGTMNVEERRVACEMIGWDNILDQLEAVVIDRDEDPEIGELVSVETHFFGMENFLRVRCGTGRDFALPVPPNMTTALEANAWTWGLEPEQYRPEVRT